MTTTYHLHVTITIEGEEPPSREDVVNEVHFLIEDKNDHNFQVEVTV